MECLLQFEFQRFGGLSHSILDILHYREQVFLHVGRTQYHLLKDQLLSCRSHLCLSCYMPILLSFTCPSTLYRIIFLSFSFSFKNNTASDLSFKTDTLLSALSNQEMTDFFTILYEPIQLHQLPKMDTNK